MSFVLTASMKIVDLTKVLLSIQVCCNYSELYSCSYIVIVVVCLFLMAAKDEAHPNKV